MNKIIILSIITFLLILFNKSYIKSKYREYKYKKQQKHSKIKNDNI